LVFGASGARYENKLAASFARRSTYFYGEASDKKSFPRMIKKIHALGFSFFWAKPKGQKEGETLEHGILFCEPIRLHQASWSC